MSSRPIFTRLILLSRIQTGRVLGSWFSPVLAFWVLNPALNHCAGFGCLRGLQGTRGHGVRPLHSLCGVIWSEGCRRWSLCPSASEPGSPRVSLPRGLCWVEGGDPGVYPRLELQPQSAAPLGWGLEGASGEGQASTHRLLASQEGFQPGMNSTDNIRLLSA